jgi:hypothetical protein
VCKMVEFGCTTRGGTMNLWPNRKLHPTRKGRARLSFGVEAVENVDAPL